jgi:GNAT superfamily N-acetyltransferase
MAFRRNYLYSPISEAEFLERNRALLPYVRPELVLLAEQHSRLAGFVVAVPDVLQQQRAVPVDTVIVKTTAVHPEMTGRGIGGALVAIAHRNAVELGYRHAIHALMHDSNSSRRISTRSARPFRRYALLSRAIAR